MEIKKYSIFIIACLLLVISYGFYKGHHSSGKKLKKGDPAPAFTLPDLDGNKVTLSSYKGQLVLVDFWASWCIPCRHENPKIKALYNRFKKRKFEDVDGFEVISISVDEHRSAWLKAVEKDALNWKQLLDADSKVADEYFVKRLPTTFLIDEKGIIKDINPYLDDLDWKLQKYTKDW